MGNIESILRIQSYIDAILEKFSKKLVYHNKLHVEDVFKSVSEIAIYENICEKDIFLLKVAALYHDIGFIETYIGHEDVSKKIVMQSLPSFGVGDNDITKICGMIEASKIPQCPKNHLEEIICDADLDNLGRDDFFHNMDLLFQEKYNFNFITDKNIWYKQTFEMIVKHRYFCKSSHQRRNSLKEKNVNKLKQMIEKNIGAAE